MKKILLLIISLLLINGCAQEEAFYLNEEYYGQSEFLEIDNIKLKELEDNKESFVIVVYNTNCIGSYNFVKLVEKYLESNEIKLYKIVGNKTKDTQIKEKIEYFPTMVIYKDGKIINYLKTDKESDLKYYEDVLSLENWLENQILMK